jgi:hypothetical protein
MDEQDWIEACQAELRVDLGLRPETRIDVIIFADGAAFELQPDGALKRVR